MALYVNTSPYNLNNRTSILTSNTIQSNSSNVHPSLHNYSPLDSDLNGRWAFNNPIGGYSSTGINQNGSTISPIFSRNSSINMQYPADIAG